MDGDLTVVVLHRDVTRRAALEAAVGRLARRVVACATAEAVLAETAAERPSLAVLHAGSGGLVVCRELQERFAPEIPTIVVIDRSDAEERVAALLIGADDCLSEPVDPEELLARARRSVRRNGHHRNGDPGDSRMRSLSARELQILRLLSRGLSQKDISRQLVISSKTVGTHVQHTLTKLGVHSRAEAAAFGLARGLGRD